MYLTKLRPSAPTDFTYSYFNYLNIYLKNVQDIKARLEGCCGSLFVANYFFLGLKMHWSSWYENDIRFSQTVFGSVVTATHSVVAHLIVSLFFFKLSNVFVQ